MFLHNLVEAPKSFLEVKNSKEALDRALAVDPDQIMVIKSLADYYLFKREYLSVCDEYMRLFRLKMKPHQKHRAYINVSSHFINAQKYSEAQQYLDKAESINPNFQLYFMKFKLHYLKYLFTKNAKNSIEPAIDNITKMDALIETTEIDVESASLISKWFKINIHDLLRYNAEDQTISRIVNKYSDKILDK